MWPAYTVTLEAIKILENDNIEYAAHGALAELGTVSAAMHEKRLRFEPDEDKIALFSPIECVSLWGASGLSEDLGAEDRQSFPS